MTDECPPQWTPGNQEVLALMQQLNATHLQLTLLQRQYDAALARIGELEAEVATGKRICESLASRCAGQSDALAKRAEKPPITGGFRRTVTGAVSTACVCGGNLWEFAGDNRAIARCVQCGREDPPRGQETVP